MFRVWAPHAKEVELAIIDGRGETRFKMEEESRGYFSKVEDAREEMKYAFIIDGKNRRADPASRYQPDGVHGDSKLVDPSSYSWSDASWNGVALNDLVIYELHVGTFTKEGTFESLIPFLDYLGKDLGITAIEIMPVAQFSGKRNWGYDGVLMYSVQNSYGGPLGLKKLIDACHSSNLAVILDVVYNHVGPEGNHLSDFGPYFSSKYRTPWGAAINYDDAGCDEVRKYVVNNANYWVNEYHVDGLRLDAIHGIFDFSTKHILEEMKDSVEKNKMKGKYVHLIAESDLNDPKIISQEDKCGYGLDAQWSDDFHHSVHAYLTGEKYGYYDDFGDITQIEKAIRDGFVYDGIYSKFRNRNHGASSQGLSGSKFVICIQNHDQVGNRPDGKRLSALVDLSALKVAAGLLLLSPAIPMLFMGEEYAEKAPFYFFTSHSDKALVNATREGRKKEFESHKFDMDFVNPQDEKTFVKCKLNEALRFDSPNREIFEYYKELISLRKGHPAFRDLDKRNMQISLDKKQKVIVSRRLGTNEELLTLVVLNRNSIELRNVATEDQWILIHSSTGGKPKRDSSSIQLPSMSVTVYKKPSP